MTHTKILYLASLIFVSFNLRAQTYISATGGTITTDGDYKVHTFTSSGTFTVTGGSGNVEVLVVAGGGSGGGSTAGGGGAGGLIHDSAFAVTTQSYSVIVGDGGAQSTQQTSGNNGQNSVFGTLTATGGGGGGFTSAANMGGAGLNGGSGGGGTKYSGQAYVNGIGTTGQGNNGGTYGTDAYPGGGGGGAGAPGSAPASTHSGDGGVGLAVSISGSSVYYAGGGGGGSSAQGGSGGIGGGGAGTSNGTAGIAGLANSGGGGGGGWYYSGGIGGAGGSGIVIIRYQFQSASHWVASGNNILYNAGNVGIGTVNANDVNYKLFVETGIRTRKVKVDAMTWPDYVFHKNYKLASLDQIERYIKLNGHLPQVPSENEVKKNGIDLGDNQALLLKKIEELTLLLIEENKKIKSLESKLQSLSVKKSKKK